jgi:rhodanese-related sulfurtransferase
MDRLLEYCAHHPWLAGFAIVAALAVIAFEAREQAGSADALSPQEVIRLMNQGATVLDLRAETEYAAGHISGARQFDPGRIGAAADTLKKYKERALVVYCDRGPAAAAAVRKLAAQGFTKVFNLRGGLSAWRAENLPLTRE